MRIFATTLALLATLLMGACSGDKVTEIVLAISTDIPLLNMDRIRLEAFSGESDSSFTALTWDLTDQEPDPNATGTVNALVRLPAYLGVVPGEAGSITRPVRFVLQGSKIDVADPNKDDFILERQAKLTFVRDRTLLLRLALIGRCIGVKCGEDKTCGEQGCEDIDKKSDELPGFSEDGAAQQPPGDGGPRDGFIVPPQDLKEKIPDGGPQPDLKEKIPDGGPLPDGRLDGPKLDGPKLDGPKLDGPKLDGPVSTPDGTKADGPRPPDLGGPKDQGSEDFPQMPDFGGPQDQGSEDFPQMPDFGGPQDQGSEDFPQMPDFGPPQDQGSEDFPLMPDFGVPDQYIEDFAQMPDFGPMPADGATASLG